MNILGVNAFHGDSAACLVVDGKLVAAVEEERFKRAKHWAGLPTESVKYCLKAGGIKITDVQHIAVNRNPDANLFKKVLFAFARKPSLNLVQDRLKNSFRVRDIRRQLEEALLLNNGAVKAELHPVEHHHAHLASAYFVSDMDSAAVVSVDGFGDFVSTMWGRGIGSSIEMIGQVYFPHSLGLFYLMMTQFLGFPEYGDEYKVMGLAAYGKPVYLDKMRKIIRLKSEGQFELDLDYFLHHSEGVSMTWESGKPELGKVFANRLIDLLGPPRVSTEPVTERHKDLAASTQAFYEEVFFHILEEAYRQSQNPNLCLAGGCAMNSVANGKIYAKTPFKKMFIQPAAGDAGGAIGAAFHVWNGELKKTRVFRMEHAYWGPEFSEKEIQQELSVKNAELKKENCDVLKIEDQDELCRKTAQAIADGKVVGWFEGRMEWGPRALGNRSILGDPRRADMKEILNLKIKRRESFRPFAPSILREKTFEWFEVDDDVPFMLQVYPIREDKRKMVPAVAHVDGSGRLQTVTEEQNPLYYRLIRAFESLTAVPMVLNTSFNESEPVVCKPIEALNCFLRTKMDVLVLGNIFIQRRSS